jgi:hypothetical protein
VARKPSHGVAKPPAFNGQGFLASAGVAKTIVRFGRGDAIFTQGDACGDVMYVQSGSVKLSVLSKTGREAVVAMLRPGDFFGEGCGSRGHECLTGNAGEDGGDDALAGGLLPE